MRRVRLSAGGLNGIRQGIAKQEDRAIKPCPLSFSVVRRGGGYISGKRKIESHKGRGSGQKTFEMHFSFLRFRSNVARADELRQGRTHLTFILFYRSSVPTFHMIKAGLLRRKYGGGTPPYLRKAKPPRQIIRSI